MSIAWEGEVRYGGSSCVVVSGGVDDNVKWLKRK